VHDLPLLSATVAGTGLNELPGKDSSAAAGGQGCQLLPKSEAKRASHLAGGLVGADALAQHLGRLLQLAPHQHLSFKSININ
jgi:hypothetical protein